MRRGMKVKQGKSVSFLGMIGGIIVLFMGLSMGISQFGTFGVLWILGGVAITGFHAYNFFSRKGVASWEVDINTGVNEKINNHLISSTMGDFETRLRKLNKLKEDGLITEEEFQKKREEILQENW